MATEKSALAAALDRQPFESEKEHDLILAAARERLAQLPEKCEHGLSEGHRQALAYVDGVPWVGNPPGPSWCPGKVYPAELVERIARIFYDSDVAAVKSRGGKVVPWQQVITDAPRSPWHIAAVAVLDALNGETP